MVSQPTVAGVAQCVLDWSAGLRARGWDATVACPADGWLAQRCRDASIPVMEWPSVRSPTAGLSAESRRLAHVVAATDPDVVFLHSSKAGLVGRLVLRGRRRTAFAPHAWSFDAADGAVGRAALAWERFAVRWTDRIVCVSSAEEQRGRAARVRGRFVVARNGVDAGGLAAQAGGRDAARAELGVGPGTVVVCVGRLGRQKGQDVLVTAWVSRPADPTRRLVLVGGGEDEAALRSLAGGRDDVRFVGDLPRDRALRWLAAADLAVVPSRWEGMALVPLEALALGVPVVASDVTGVREAVDDEVGSLVPADDAAALAAAVDRWLGRTPEERRAAGDRARRRIRQRFDLATTVGVLDTELRSLADRASRPGRG